MNPENTMSPFFLTYTKPVVACIGASGLYLADIMTTGLESMPTWISELGLPTSIIVCLVYATVSLYKAGRLSEDNRIKDRDMFIETLRADSAQSQQSREAIIASCDKHAAAFEKQANAFDRLTDEIRRKHE